MAKRKSKQLTLPDLGTRGFYLPWGMMIGGLPARRPKWRRCWVCVKWRAAKGDEVCRRCQTTALDRMELAGSQAGWTRNTTSLTRPPATPVVGDEDTSPPAGPGRYHP